ESPTCAKCEGALKNAPVMGLVILIGLKKDGDEYTGGKILYPDNGKVYSSKIYLADEGKKLKECVDGNVSLSQRVRNYSWRSQT
ncbi:DUF2147 domain-containing protein, partial [Rhizobium ruizarguesonis]